MRLHFLFALLPIALTAACASHPKMGVVEPRAVEGFSKVVSNGPVDVHVAIGPEHAVVVRCDDRELSPYVETRLNGTELVVDAKFPQTSGPFFHFGTNARCTVD